MSCGFSAGDRPRRGARSRPSRGVQQAEDRLDQGRLAGAVGPDDVTISPSRDVDRDAVEDVDLGHVAGDDALGASTASRCARSPGRSAISSASGRPPARRRGRRRSRAWSRRTSSGSPSAITRPSAITITRSEWFITTSMSCSMNRKVTPSSARSRCMWSSRRRAEGRVDARHRLVEQQEARLGHQRPRELEQLALAAGERARVVVRELGQVEDLEQLHRLRRAPRVSRCAPGARADDQVAAAARRAGRAPPASCCRSPASRASAFVIWKVRTMPRRAIAYGGRPRICVAVERRPRRRRPGRSR